MTDPIIRQGQVESELGWVIHHAKQAQFKQGAAPTHLRYYTRQDLRDTIQRLQALLDDAEANYEAYKDAAA